MAAVKETEWEYMLEEERVNAYGKWKEDEIKKHSYCCICSG